MILPTCGLQKLYELLSPCLCAPVILGLPFLSHNNIVIDHVARTVIDKMSVFDPMNLPFTYA